MTSPLTTAPSSPTPLSPTGRTTVRRGRHRARADRAELWDVLDAALVCHLAVVVDGAPLVLPTAFGADPDGPDRDGTLYLHGSVASRSLGAARERDVCATFTVVDGLVLARSGFHHSMNYRSAVVRGTARPVTDPVEHGRALALVVDQLVPGRTATLRPPTRKELVATAVLAVSLHEASVKARTGDPVDDEPDVAAGTWAGVVGVRTVLDAPVAAADVAPGTPVPGDVSRRVAAG